MVGYDFELWAAQQEKIRQQQINVRVAQQELAARRAMGDTNLETFEMMLQGQEMILARMEYRDAVWNRGYVIHSDYCFRRYLTYSAAARKD